MSNGPYVRQSMPHMLKLRLVPPTVEGQPCQVTLSEPLPNGVNWMGLHYYEFRNVPMTAGEPTHPFYNIKIEAAGNPTIYASNNVSSQGVALPLDAQFTRKWFDKDKPYEIAGNMHGAVSNMNIYVSAPDGSIPVGVNQLFSDATLLVEADIPLPRNTGYEQSGVRQEAARSTF